VICSRQRAAKFVNRLKNFCARSGEERSIVLQALILLHVARLSLSVCGFKATRGLFETVSRIRARHVIEPGRDGLPGLTMQCVHAAARHALFGAVCLPRSVVLCTLLRRRGFHPTLRFGARSTDGRFEAHAWVELGGRVLDPTGNETHTFVPFPCKGALS